MTLLRLTGCGRVLLTLLVAAFTLIRDHVVSGNAQSSETVLQAPGPLGSLEGVLQAPDATASATVLIIPGSGPTDRDGNNLLGVSAATYRYLALGLAKAGISSVRIDKRGMFGSANAVEDANNVTLADYADDVHAWIKVAQAQSGHPCIWLLGHSEGALVAMLAAQRNAPICGLILIASPGRKFADVLRQQLRDNPANKPLLDDASGAIDALEAGRKVDVSKFHPALQGLFAPQVQGFMSDLMAYDPIKMISKVSLPVLILQGGRDIQVSVSDAEQLHAGNSNSTLVLLPDVNHVLKEVGTDSREDNLATYTNLSLPVKPDLIDAIVEFMAAAR